MQSLRAKTDPSASLETQFWMRHIRAGMNASTAFRSPSLVGLHVMRNRPSGATSHVRIGPGRPKPESLDSRLAAPNTSWLPDSFTDTATTHLSADSDEHSEGIKQLRAVTRQYRDDADGAEACDDCYTPVKNDFRRFKMTTPADRTKSVKTSWHHRA